MKKTIVIGSDHAGYRMKQYLIEQLTGQGYTVEDKGPQNEDAVDAGIYATAVAETVAADRENKLGMLICGTGVGMSIMANKVNGIRAALVGDLFTAKMTRSHNHSNVLCMGARVIAEGMAWEIASAWLAAEPLGGKYAERVQRIMDYENRH